jgi:hypothetical protein
LAKKYIFKELASPFVGNGLDQAMVTYLEEPKTIIRANFI